MTITLNGDTRTIDQNMSLEALLISLDINPKKVAVERNREIVPKSTFADVVLTHGDQLEIVHFIGGG